MRVVGWYALRWRRLASRAEVRMQGRRNGPPHRSPSRARDQRSLAHHGPAGARDAGQPAKLMFSDMELLVIEDYATKLPRTPKPGTLKAALLIVAAGYRNRNPPTGIRKSGRIIPVSPAIVRHTRAEIKKSGRSHPCSVQKRICDDRAGAPAGRRRRTRLPRPGGSSSRATNRRNRRPPQAEPASRAAFFRGGGRVGKPFRRPRNRSRRRCAPRG